MDGQRPCKMMFLDQNFWVSYVIICDPYFAEADCRWGAQVLHFAVLQGISRYYMDLYGIIMIYNVL